MAPRTGLAGRWRPLLVTGGLSGLAVTIIGTFLPWLGSGTAQRNSYAAGGAVRRLVAVSHPINEVLAAWPAIGLVAALAVLAVVLGHPVVGLWLALVVAAVAGTSAAAVLGVHGNRYAHVLATGPVTTLIGAMLVALTGLTTLGAALTRRPR